MRPPHLATIRRVQRAHVAIAVAPLGLAAVLAAIGTSSYSMFHLGAQLAGATSGASEAAAPAFLGAAAACGRGQGAALVLLSKAAAAAWPQQQQQQQQCGDSAICRRQCIML
jgi:hypothetical protein